MLWSFSLAIVLTEKSECCGCGQSFFSEVVLKKLLHPPAGESGDRLECLTTTLTTFLAVWFPKRELPLCINKPSQM